MKKNLLAVFGWVLLLPIPLNAQTSFAPIMKELVTEKVATRYVYAYPENLSKINVVQRQGKRWVEMALKGDVWAGFGLGLGLTNLVPLRQYGSLQFYVRGSKGGETTTVGFIMDKGTKEEEKFNLMTEVPLTNYTKVTAQWQLVTIPISDFPEKGYHHDDATDSKITGVFKWDRVLEFGGNHSPTENVECELFFSSIRVIPSYDKKAVPKARSKALGD